MKQTVLILHSCGEYTAGQTAVVDERRARRLVLTGYARIAEAATVTAEESAEQVRPAPRGRKSEQRG